MDRRLFEVRVTPQAVSGRVILAATTVNEQVSGVFSTGQWGPIVGRPGRSSRRRPADQSAAQAQTGPRAAALHGGRRQGRPVSPSAGASRGREQLRGACRQRRPSGELTGPPDIVTNKPAPALTEGQAPDPASRPEGRV